MLLTFTGTSFTRTFVELGMLGFQEGQSPTPRSRLGSSSLDLLQTTRTPESTRRMCLQDTDFLRYSRVRVSTSIAIMCLMVVLLGITLRWTDSFCNNKVPNAKLNIGIHDCSLYRRCFPSDPHGHAFSCACIAWIVPGMCLGCLAASCHEWIQCNR